jgi:hypothetical protein
MSGQYDPDKTNAPERRQATVDKVHNDLRLSRERGKIEGARDRAANTETRRFGSTTMLAPAPKKAGQQIFQMFGSESHSLSVVSTTLSRRRNFALAS